MRIVERGLTAFQTNSEKDPLRKRATTRILDRSECATMHRVSQQASLRLLRRYPLNTPRYPASSESVLR